MIEYDKQVLKDVEKGKIPEKVFLQIHHCLESIQLIGDLSIFDIKKLKSDDNRDYLRIRKGNYRAIFFLEGDVIKVFKLGHRKEVYRK